LNRLFVTPAFNRAFRFRFLGIKWASTALYTGKGAEILIFRCINAFSASNVSYKLDLGRRVNSQLAKYRERESLSICPAAIDG